MLPRNHPDRIQITFDDRRLVANAGLLLPATLARHLGLPELVRQRLDLGDAPGRANTSDKMMTLVASALAGGDCIDDADVLRTGGTACTLGGTVKAPSTLGTFLRNSEGSYSKEALRQMRPSTSDLEWLTRCIPGLLYDKNANEIAGEIAFCAAYDSGIDRVRIGNDDAHRRLAAVGPATPPGSTPGASRRWWWGRFERTCSPSPTYVSW